MRGKGNGAINVCANNLLQMFRGEVPYERIKGLDPRLIDAPIGDAKLEIQQDAEWLLETYEPRATVNGVSFGEESPSDGGFSVVADIKEKEE